MRNSKIEFYRSMAETFGETVVSALKLVKLGVYVNETKIDDATRVAAHFAGQFLDTPPVRRSWASVRQGMKF